MFRFMLTVFALGNGYYAYALDNSFNWFVCGMCTACALDAFINERRHV